ncbi:carboxymuconolactone decarboxylase family protein [Sphingomonas koreensis]|nr:carboxymuconolactone decarboxylase family protein [Sphingomonas koreensis]
MNKPTGYTTKAGVPFPSEEDIRRAMGDKYRPETLNVTKMLAGTGDCFPPVVELVRVLFQTEGVDPKLREVVTLRVAKLLDAPYEWQQNSRMALNVGLEQADIDTLAADGPVTGVKPEYVTACAAADELTKGGTLTDETLRALLDLYGDVVTRKLILMIGYFNLLGMFLNGCRVPLETTDKIGTTTSPLG